MSVKNKKKVFIIAEIGCNHNGNFELAKEMIYRARDIGVDAIKFQLFNSEAMVTKNASKADYQKKETGEEENQLEMIKKLELSELEYLELKKIAEVQNLIVFATPFDDESINFLERIGQKIWKIPSGEITNLPYLEKINNIEIKDKEVILSTGMSTIKEIEDAVKILKDCDNLTILHCNTEYPTPDSDVNLRAILDLKGRFPNLKIGYSDHSDGIVASIGAVALGASIIEKHFTLDKNLEGPDHKASSTPDEILLLSTAIRRLEKMLGNREKIVTKSEEKNIAIARKSIVAKESIKKGEIFTDANITCKRPGTGISPIYWYKVLGKEAEKDFEIDELISCKGVKKEDE